MPKTRVALRDCPPGLFLFNGKLGFKTEYGELDAYCAETGEAFWGGKTRNEDRAQLLVQPVSIKGGIVAMSLVEQALAEARAEEREQAAAIAENFTRKGRDWVRDSLWDNITKGIAAAILSNGSKAK
jgi:hypothetical protein